MAEFLPAEDIVGLDISEGMLLRAKCRLGKIVHGDSQRLPFRDGTFDVVLCRALLHHLPDPRQGIAEMARVLKPGGEIIVSEPIKSVVSSLPRRLVGGGGHFSEVHKDFTDTELLTMLREKFHLCQTRYFGYIAYPLLGFPDIFDPLKYLPLKRALAFLLIGLDRVIARVPGIRKQAWGIIIKAQK
jgi:ubiquinone/menaquinone biosynthesis C-methylase UbiE